MTYIRYCITGSVDVRSQINSALKFLVSEANFLQQVNKRNVERCCDIQIYLIIFVHAHRVIILCSIKISYSSICVQRCCNISVTQNGYNELLSSIEAPYQSQGELEIKLGNVKLIISALTSIGMYLG